MSELKFSSIIENSMYKKIYYVLLALLVISGFGQMPLFKRYYVASIPGFQWTGNFIVTHYLHYIGAVLFLTLCAYIASLYLLDKTRNISLSMAGKFRVAVLAGLIFTGALKVVENIPGVILPPAAVLTLDITHILFTMILLFSGIYFLIKKRDWSL